MEKKAFTLIELLVVVTVVGILGAIGTIMFNKYLDGAKETACKTNHESIKKKIQTNYSLCKLSRTGTIEVRQEYNWRNKILGNKVNVPCSRGFHTIAYASAISMTNYLDDPYNDEAWPYAVMAYNGTPPKNGYTTFHSYYGNNSKITLRTRCRNKVITNDMYDR